MAVVLLLAVAKIYGAHFAGICSFELGQAVYTQQARILPTHATLSSYTARNQALDFEHFTRSVFWGHSLGAAVPGKACYSNYSDVALQLFSAPDPRTGARRFRPLNAIEPGDGYVWVGPATQADAPMELLLAAAHEPQRKRWFANEIRSVHACV